MCLSHLCHSTYFVPAAKAGPYRDGAENANPSVLQEPVPFGIAAEGARLRALKYTSSHASCVLNCLCVDESTKFVDQVVCICTRMHKFSP